MKLRHSYWHTFGKLTEAYYATRNPAYWGASNVRDLLREVHVELEDLAESWLAASKRFEEDFAAEIAEQEKRREQEKRDGLL